GAVDGEGDAIGDGPEELNGLAAEAPGAARADADDAEEAALDDERGAEHGADALLACDRIDEVEGVDVVDGNGAALGGDASGEAGAEWHAAPAPSAQVKSHRGTDDEA